MMTTTGFASTDFTAWPSAALLVLFGLVVSSFAPFSAVSKLAMTVLMYLGRLEILPVLVLLRGELLG